MTNLKKNCSQNPNHKLASFDICTGCSACLSICPTNAITFSENDKGFLHPIIDQKLCIGCNRCNNVCPVLNHKTCNDIHFKEIYASWSNNSQIRQASSSGGLFSELAIYVLEQGGVVCGAAYIDGVKHIVIDSIDDLKKLQGSKYVQSDLGGVYHHIAFLLKKGILVLFSGTPCQIDGLKHFLDKDYDNLYTLDLVCHGAPSPKIWNDYVKWIEKKYESKVLEVRFRSKRIGWRCQGTEIFLDNGKIIFKDLFHDFFSRGFLRNYTLREACFNCVYSNLNRPADITLADFWGYKSSSGWEDDDDKGISMVMLNNDKGQYIFQKIKDKIISQKRLIEHVLPYQPTLNHPSPKPCDYDDFWIDYHSNDFNYVRRKYMYIENKAAWERFKISKLGRKMIRLKVMIINILRRKSNL